MACIIIGNLAEKSKFNVLTIVMSTEQLTIIIDFHEKS